MRTIKLATVTAATGFALAILAAPSAEAAPGAKADGAVPALSTASIECGKGLGGNAKVNFSWNRGYSTTTIYFNNHCKKGKLIMAAVVTRHYSEIVGWQYFCVPLDTHGQTKGKKKFGTVYYSVWKVLRGHKNKYCKAA